MRVEAFARYKRMKDYNVLFPQAWHCTGSPIVDAAQRVKEREENMIDNLKNEGFGEEEISKFEDPVYWVKVFSKKWHEDLNGMGLSIDWRRNFITSYLNPYYDKFIQWQFRKLKEKGYIAKGKHPVVWDPKTNMPVGDHDRIRGEGQVPQEFVLLKFKFRDCFIVAATLRPETVFGQTNLWINPEIEYVRAKVNSENWIISEGCVEKLRNQDKDVEVVGYVKGKELIGKYCVAPYIKKEIIILPSKFCDPNKGTGIVTSVPSDAPDDYVGLMDLWKNKSEVEKYGLDYDELKSIKIISIINSKDLGKMAAVKVVADMKIKNQNEREKLEEAKKIVYKKGFYEGVMNKNCGKYKGMKVEVAKEKLKKALLKTNEADLFYELTGEVISRGLTKCIVKIVSDQWFIKYGDEKWKKLTKEALKNVKLYPENVREQFNYVINWLNDWACTREYGLGTMLPFDDKWLIESLSDSTIYTAYYTISHLIKEIPIDKVNDEFFDYVFLGKGKIKNYEKLRNEFEYWYPVDFRNSGKDLVQNHLSFYIFNHVAIFNKKYWPKGIGVNGWVKVNNEKMSKSLGNVILLRELRKKYGADAARLTILSGGEGLDDSNWDGNFAEMIKNRLNALYDFVIENYNKGRDYRKEIDNWMDNELNKIIKDANELMEKTLFRSAIQKIYFDLQSKLKWYLRRSKPNKKVINRVIETQILLLSIFCPYLCEELWNNIRKNGFVSLEKWPKLVKINYKGNEEYIKKVMEDVRHILKIVKFKPKILYLYVLSSEVKYLYDAKEFFENEFNLEFNIFSTSDKNIYDPKQKSKKAVKGRAAIYLE